MRRESKNGQSGRTQEIQRLIGRSLRAGIDRVSLGERQIIIDCDVIQADGGTRTASISGAYVALCDATNHLLANKRIKRSPVIGQLASVSVGVFNGLPVLDLDYDEDSEAGTDGNFVMTGSGRLIELQASAEGATFSRDQFNELMDLADQGVAALVAAQKAAVA